MSDVNVIIYCANVEVLPTPNITPGLRAILTDIDYDDILNQVPIAEAVRYYGAHNLLTNMEAGEIKEYMNYGKES